MVVVKFKKLCEDAVIPSYTREQDACMDLTSVEDCVVKAKSYYAIKTGLAPEIPKGYVMHIHGRSGTAFKNGVGLVNGVGVIDHEYRGELYVILFNMGEQDFVVEKGMRVAQFCIWPVLNVVAQQVDVISETQRGESGLGSSGMK